MTRPDSSYAKPFLTVPEQIRRLRGRGMDCGSDDFASRVLERYGYYRLSGYWHPYRARPAPPASERDGEGREIRLDAFVEGASLAHVVALYDFDHELRTRIGALLSVIETSFRFFIGHRLGRIDVFAHRRPDLLGSACVRENDGSPTTTAAYDDWLKEYERHEKRARDTFVLHFRAKYGPHLPVWVATEVMSFGVLSNLYTLMPQLDKEVLAARLQIKTADGRGDHGALGNWLNNLRNVRNICAHYGRLWNRTLDVLIDAPGEARRNECSHLARLSEEGVNNKLYGVLVIMRYLLLSISPGNDGALDLVGFIEHQSRTVGFRMSQLGFPEGWSDEPLWASGFSVDPLPMLAASLLDRAKSLTAAEAREGLAIAVPRESVAPRASAQAARATKAAQRRLLRTYLHYGVLIEVELGGANHYPAFQFRDRKIVDALAEVNKTLTDRCADAHPLLVAAALLDWWQTPNADLPAGDDDVARSPLDLLEAVPESEFTELIVEADGTSTFVAPSGPLA